MMVMIDLVTGLEHRGRKALGDQVELTRSCAGEDDLVDLGSADDVSDAADAPSRWHPVASTDSEYRAAQLVGVHTLVEVAFGVKHAGGALRSGGAYRGRRSRGAAETAGTGPL